MKRKKASRRNPTDASAAIRRDSESSPARVLVDHGLQIGITTAPQSDDAAIHARSFLRPSSPSREMGPWPGSADAKSTEQTASRSRLRLCMVTPSRSVGTAFLYCVPFSPAVSRRPPVRGKGLCHLRVAAASQACAEHRHLLPVRRTPGPWRRHVSAAARHPDLEHLRKQAKALLRDLRTRDTEAKLADALHLVARQYGFPSWPKLKAHVRSIVHAEHAPDPGKLFTGRWIADVARSIRHPANQFQRAALDITVTGTGSR